MSTRSPSPSTAAADERFMRRALRLARRGWGFVEPNPMVGCVLVRDGRVIGEGFHRRFGGPHAEVNALAAVEGSARGATAYVTLEPCCIHGKTPPCTDVLLAAGVARVVAGTIDPNPAVSGRGLRLLRRAGIRADLGVLRPEADALIAPFAKVVRTGRPWVIAKWAQSLDGRIATRTGDSKWISGEPARRHAHMVRGRVDAILVGVNTVLRDDPELTCRMARPRRIAARVVLDTSLRTPVGSKLVRTAWETPTWIFCGAKASAAKRRALERAGCTVIAVKSDASGVSLAAVIDKLGARHVSSVVVEGGSSVLGSLFDARLVDEVHVYIAPRIIGGREALGAVGGNGTVHMDAATELVTTTPLRAIGREWFFGARVFQRQPGTTRCT